MPKSKLLACKECGKSISDPSDLISFKKEDEWVAYHRQCYADRFGAPHALNK